MKASTFRKLVASIMVLFILLLLHSNYQLNKKLDTYKTINDRQAQLIKKARKSFPLTMNNIIADNTDY